MTKWRVFDRFGGELGIVEASDIEVARIMADCEYWTAFSEPLSLIPVREKKSRLGQALKAFFAPAPTPVMQKPVEYRRPVIQHKSDGRWCCFIQYGTLGELRNTGYGPTPILAYMHWVSAMIHHYDSTTPQGLSYTQWLNRAYWNTRHGVLEDNGQTAGMIDR